MQTRFSRRMKLIYYYPAVNKLFSKRVKKLAFDDEQFCELMLPRNRGEGMAATDRLGLDILERCWQSLEKEVRVRGKVLRRLLRKVSSPDDVQRLKRWRKRMETEMEEAGRGEIGAKGNEGAIGKTVGDRQWVWNILDTVDAKLEALESCRSMMQETFKKVFK